MRVGSVMQRMRVVAGTLAAGRGVGKGAGRGSRPLSSLSLPESHVAY